jgi:hypothetical protein
VDAIARWKYVGGVPMCKRAPKKTPRRLRILNVTRMGLECKSNYAIFWKMHPKLAHWLRPIIKWRTAATVVSSRQTR